MLKRPDLDAGPLGPVDPAEAGQVRDGALVADQPGALGAGLAALVQQAFGPGVRRFGVRVCRPVVGELGGQARFEDGVEPFGLRLVALGGVGDFFGRVAVEVVCLALGVGKGGVWELVWGGLVGQGGGEKGEVVWWCGGSCMGLWGLGLGLCAGGGWQGREGEGR